MIFWFSESLEEDLSNGTIKVSIKLFANIGHTMDNSPWSNAEKWQIMAPTKFWIETLFVSKLSENYNCLTLDQFMAVERPPPLHMHTHTQGRVVSSIKSPGVQSSMLSQQTTSLSRDTVVIRDHRDDKSKCVIFLYVHTDSDGSHCRGSCIWCSDWQRVRWGETPSTQNRGGGCGLESMWTPHWAPPGSTGQEQWPLHYHCERTSC